MPAPADQPRWPRGAPDDPEGHGQGGRWRSRNQATGWVEALSRRAVGTPLWADRGKIARLAIQRPIRESRLSGGAIAQTKMLEYDDGSVAVRKTFSDDDAGRGRASAEYLASLVAEAVGAPAPAVVKDPTNPDYAVIMGFVSGDPGTVHTGSANADEWGQALYYLAVTDAGKRIGLLDVLISNADRHSMNWVLSDELEEPNHWGGLDQSLRRPIAIDHSETFATPDERLIDRLGVRVRPREEPDARQLTAPLEVGAYGGFSFSWLERGAAIGLTGTVIGLPDIYTYRGNNPLHPEDVDVLRGRLGALRAKFDGEDMLDAWVLMMRRFDHLAARAGGTDRMFPDD